MQLVTTIIAACGSKISPTLLQKLAGNNRASWLAEDEAVDIFLAGNADDHRQQFLKTIDGEPIDIIVQPTAYRRKKLLAADMESTIIEQELLDELAGEIGVRDKVARITERTMNGELDFAAALRARMALFDEQPRSLLEKVVKQITYTPGAETLVATMKKKGAQAWLITGGFSFFAEPVAAALGFDRCFANELVLKNDIITGEVREPILDRLRKQALVKQACGELDLTPAECLAVGDGANDVPMLNFCNSDGGLGIAFQAKPKVRAAVAHQINHGDLTALLYAQGYKKQEFINV